MKREPMVEERPVTFTVKVVYHDYDPGNMPGQLWEKCDSIDEAIKAWGWGAERPGAHGWDKESCHVCFVEGEVWLLYVTDEDDVG